MASIKGFGRSKAKAALARANYILDEDISSILSRLLALEAGSASIPVKTKTADYTATIDDRVILGDATTLSIEITLRDPTVVGAGGTSIWLSISKIDGTANTVTILPHASETIAGDSSFVLAYQNEVLGLITDGTNWYLKD